MDLSATTDKSLYQAPSGLQDVLPEEDTEIEVELIGEDGSITPVDPATDTAPAEPKHGDNLAEIMSEGALRQLASDLDAEVQNDLLTRSDWEKAYTTGLELLGLHMEEKQEPWPGACGVYHPMITEAVVRFQAELTTETFPASGPVRTKILGKDTPEKRQAAKRVEEDMNHQLTDVMQEYRPEHERMLWNLPMTGSAFKKVYYDPTLGRQTSLFVPAEDVILPYGTTDMQTCNRFTHRMRKTIIDIERLQESGFYRSVESVKVQESAGTTSDVADSKDKEAGLSPINDTRPELYEVHADLMLDDYEKELIVGGDKVRPYVVTMVKNSSQVLAVRRNWEEKDQLALKRQHFVHYQYVPGFGAYGFGLFHLVGGYARSATSLLRQLVDAGTLSNVPGGFKTKGLRIVGEDAPVRPGEFRDVHVGAGTISENIMALPYKEPSQVLAGLLEKIVEDGRRLAATADIQVSEMSSQAPVGTTLALLERTLKVMTAVQARCHFALKQEFKLIAGIIRDYADDSYDYEPETGARRARKDDFATVEIIPVSDPNAATMSQRLMQYQAALQMADAHPQMYNMPALHREMLEVLGIKNAAKILPMPEDMKPKDPITENMRMLKGEPTKAFIAQDHEAHTAVHQMLLQDPKIQAAIGQNPQAQAMAAAIMSHIAEHAAFAYRMQVSAQLGVPLPDPEQDMDPELERQIAPLLAQAAQQSLMANQKQAAQKEAEQKAQDPGLQLEIKKIGQKDRELDIKEMATKGTIANQADRNEIDKTRLLVDTAKIADELDMAQDTAAHQQVQNLAQMGAQSAQAATKNVAAGGGE